jgi:excisionase family DNA binding protein
VLNVEIRFFVGDQEIASLDSFTQTIVQEVRASVRDELSQHFSKQDNLKGQTAPRKVPETSRRAVSIREAARLLSISTRTLQNYISLKAIPTIRIGRRVLIPAKSVDEISSRGIPQRRIGTARTLGQEAS